jgi:hypothetical protein
MDDVEKRADRKIVALLVSAGVDVASRGGGGGLGDLDGTEELFDQEPIDPRPPIPDAPAFTIDDLIDFHFSLLDDGYIQAFLAKQ